MPSTNSSAEPWKPNLRLREVDYKRVLSAAAREQMNVSTWIREAALARAELIFDGAQCRPLVYDTAHGSGKPVSIRFSADEAKRIRRAALKEGFLPSTWIRAVAVQRVGEGKERGGDEESTGGKRAATSRKRVKNRPVAAMPMVGKSRRQASAGS